MGKDDAVDSVSRGERRLKRQDVTNRSLWCSPSRAQDLPASFARGPGNRKARRTRKRRHLPLVHIRPESVCKGARWGQNARERWQHMVGA
jgi:hypothetical protein